MSEPKHDSKPKAKPEGKPEGKKGPQPPDNVVQLFSDRCSAEGCNKKASRAGFCEEHYLWFKEGLITLQGKKAKDFDKKYELFLEKQRTRKAA
jgi:hypothetical protein